MRDVFTLGLAFFLVLLNAFFVAAEFGMVKLRQTRVLMLQKNHPIKGEVLASVHKHLDAYLSACQLGITLASLGLGWVGEPAFAHLIEPFLMNLGFSATESLKIAAFSTAFFIITFLHIVLGELVPKSIAIRQADAVSLWTAIPLYSFYWFMYPIIWFMNSCATIVLRLMRFNVAGFESAYSTDEIKLILHSSRLPDSKPEERIILEHMLDLGELKVTDVMRPIEEMVRLNMSQSVKEALAIMQEHRYSRYPVYDSTRDEIVGIIHVKDIFAALQQNQAIENIKVLMRPILTVPRRLPALDLLRKFREGMPHFALIFSGRRKNLVGFVTLDNLLHVLVGKIKDEFHRTHDDWIKNKDGSFTLRGSASIYTLERALDIEIDFDTENIEEEFVDTLSGLIFSRIESIPKVGQRIHFSQFDMVVEKMKGPRILQVRIYPAHSPEAI